MITPEVVAFIALIALFAAILALVVSVTSYMLATRHAASERRNEATHRGALQDSLSARRVEQLEQRVGQLEQEARPRLNRERTEAPYLQRAERYSTSSESVSAPSFLDVERTDEPSLTHPAPNSDAQHFPSPEGHSEGVNEEPIFSSTLVSQLYAAWCHDHVRPGSTMHLEIGALTYERSEGSGMLGASKRHVLREVAQMAEFVRFSVPGAGEGFVLPNPDAHFTPNVAHVFPGLTRDEYDVPEALSSRAPVAVTRRSDNQWEVQ